MIVLDTTVLVYAVGSEHPLRDPCRDLIAAIAAGRVRATTTVEVPQEFTHVRARHRAEDRRPVVAVARFTHVRARHRGREDGARLARDHLDVLAPLAIVGEEDLQEGLRLYARSRRLGALDAVLAATAARLDAAAIVSADTAFAEAEIDHVVPDAAGVAQLLDG